MHFVSMAMSADAKQVEWNKGEKLENRTICIAQVQGFSI